MLNQISTFAKASLTLIAIAVFGLTALGQFPTLTADHTSNAELVAQVLLEDITPDDDGPILGGGG